MENHFLTEDLSSYSDARIETELHEILRRPEYLDGQHHGHQRAVRTAADLQRELIRRRGGDPDGNFVGETGGKAL